MAQCPLHKQLKELGLCQVARQRRHLALRQRRENFCSVALRLDRLPWLQLVQQQVEQVGVCMRGRRANEGVSGMATGARRAMQTRRRKLPRF